MINNIKNNKTKDLWIYITVTTSVFVLMLMKSSGSALLNDGLWHMAMGRYILENKTIPDYAIGAWGGESLPWIAQEWLYQLFLYILCHDNMKMAFILTYLIFYFVFMCIGIFNRLHENITTKLFGLSIFILTIILMFLGFMHPRPQAVSMMFLVFYILMLKQYLFENKSNNRHLIYMFILGVFWSNMHAGTAILGYLIPIGLLFGYFLSDKFKFIKNKFDVTHPDDINNRLSLVGLVMLISVFCTPHGIKGFMYPIESMNDSLMLVLIKEWQSPNFNDVSGLLLFWVPFLGIITWLIFEKSKKIKYYDILILALFLLLTLKHLRMAIYLLAIIALIIPKYCALNKPIDIKFNTIVFKLITCVFVLVMAFFMNAISFKSEGLTETAFFNQVKEYSGERPYNYYDLGSIMQYHQIPVFVDARYDPFSKQRMPDMYRLQNLDSTSSQMQEIMDKYNFTSIIDIKDSNVLLWASIHGFKKQADFNTGVVTKNQVGDKTDIIYELWIKSN